MAAVLILAYASQLASGKKTRSKGRPVSLSKKQMKDLFDTEAARYFEKEYYGADSDLPGASAGPDFSQNFEKFVFSEEPAGDNVELLRKDLSEFAEIIRNGRKADATTEDKEKLAAKNAEMDEERAPEYRGLLKRFLEESDVFDNLAESLLVEYLTEPRKEVLDGELEKVSTDDSYNKMTVSFNEYAKNADTNNLSPTMKVYRAVGHMKSDREALDKNPEWKEDVKKALATDANVLTQAAALAKVELAEFARQQGIEVPNLSPAPVNKLTAPEAPVAGAEVDTRNSRFVQVNAAKAFDWARLSNPEFWLSTREGWILSSVLALCILLGFCCLWGTGCFCKEEAKVAVFTPEDEQSLLSQYEDDLESLDMV